MANSDKNIRIETNKGKSGYPNIAFIGSTNDPIYLYVLDDNTISFEGSTGQLFSVSNSVTTGTIFSVNDISGIPSLRIDADGTVGIAEFSGNVGVGTVNPLYKLDVNGDINAGSGKTLRIGGTRVLDSTTLGSTVVNSSLTGVGTISSGTWNGSAVGVLYGGTGATTAADARTNLSAATAGTNSDITVLNGLQRLLVTIPTATGIGITVRGATSQTGNLQQWQNSSASNLSWINSAGTFSFGASFTHADGRTPGISVQKDNAAGIVARGYNSDSYPAIEVQNNPGSLAVGLYPSGLVYGGVLQAYSSTASTNTTTGSLIVAGGAGIAGSINAGGVSRFTSATASTSSATGGVVFSGGIGVGLTSYFASSVFIQGATASGSTSTGALVVTGGVGIGGSLQVTGTIDVADHIEIASQKELRFFNSGNTFYTAFKPGSSSANVTFTLPTADGTSNQALITNGSAALGWTSFVTAAITSLNGLTAATQTFATGTSGSDFNISSTTSTHTFNIPYAGAASTGLITTNAQTIAGAKTFSSNTIVSSSTASTSTTTGGLVVTGGVGIGGSLYTSSSSADSISGVILNNGVITSGTWAGSTITSRYGGTGYSTYTKGDMLVGAGNAITKLAVGNDLTILTADSNAGSGVSWKGLLNPSYGAFGSTTTQGVIAANTETLVDFDYTYGNNNVSIGSGVTNRVYINDSGVFDVQFSIQLSLSSGSQPQIVDVWFKVDGIPVPQSLTRQTVTGKDFESVLTVNLVQPFVSGQYIQLAYSSPDVHMQLARFTNLTSPTRPDAPSVILTVEPLTSILPGSGLAITGLASLNLLTSNAQTLVTGTSGVDFGISSAGSVHTFNIPDASATARGLITTGTQTIAGTKTFSSTITGSITGSAGSATTATTAGAAGTAVNAGSAGTSVSAGTAGTATNAGSAGTSVSAGTAGTATNAGSAGTAVNAGSAGSATTATNAGTAGTATNAGSAGTSVTAGSAGTAVNAGSAGSATTATNAGFAGAATTATSAGTAGTATNAGSAGSATTATNAGSAGTSVTAGSAGTATNTANANIVLDTTSTIYITGSRSNASIGSTAIYVLSGVSALGNTITATTFSGNATTSTTAGSAGTAVNAGNAGSATTATSAGTAGTATNAGSAGTSVTAGSAGTAVNAGSAGSATTATNAGTAGTATNAGSAGTSVTAGSATTATNAGSAGTATNAGSAGTAVNAGSAGTAVNAGRAEAIRTQTFAGTDFLALLDNDNANTTTSLYSGSGISVTSTLFVVPKDTMLGSNTNSTTSTSGALIVSGGLGVTGNLNVGGNFVLTGDLTVNGTTTTVNSTVSTVVDPIITIGTAIGGTVPNSADSKDRGVAFYYVSGTGKTGFFGWDQSVSKFALFTDATISGEVVSGTKGVLVADLDGNAGSATTSTSAGTAGTATNAGSAGTSITAGSSGSATTATSAGTAGTATNAGSAGTSVTAGSAGTSVTAGSATTATNAGFAGAATTATSAGTAGTATNAGSAGTSVTAGSATTATSAGTAGTATNAGSAGTAVNAGSAATSTNSANINVVLDTTSTLYLAGSRSNTSIGNTTAYILSGVSALGNTLSASGLNITGSTASTSSTTGALVVTGGVGIGGSLWTSTSNLASISGVTLNNGTVTGALSGNATTSTSAGSAGTAVNAGFAGAATTATTAGSAGTSVTAGSATTATNAGNAGSATTATSAGTAGTATNAGSAGTSVTAGSATTATNAGFAGAATTATSAGTAGTATNAGSAGSATTATSAGTAGTATNAGSAGTATNAGSATTATSAGTAGTATNSGSAGTATNSANVNVVLDTTSTIYLAGSRSNTSIGSTAVYVLSGVSALGNTITATTFSGNATTATSAGTAGTATNAGNAGSATTATNAGSAGTAVNAGSATTATNAGSAGTSVTAGSAGTAVNAGSATTATNSGSAGSATTATSAGTAGTATNAGSAGSATTATNSGFAGAATTATTAGSAGTSVTAGSAGTATNAGSAITATSAGTAGTATNAGSAGTSVTAGSAGTSVTAGSATTATSAGTAGTATNAGSAGTATNSANTNVVLDTTSTIYFTGSRSNASIGSTPTYVLSGVSALGNTITASGININGSTSSTSTTTGALTVTGGVGIGGTLNVGSRNLAFTASNLLAGFASSVNSYNQLVIQNLSPQSAASSDYIVSNDVSTDSTFYGSMGMNSSGYTGAGSFNLPSAVYFTSTSGDLVLGSTTANILRFVYNSGATDSMQITGTAVTVLYTTTSTSSSTGALIVAGGVGIGGSLWTAVANLSSISGVSHINSTITSGAWAGTAISAVNGGTGQNTYTIGDILYASSTTALTRLAAGTANSVLTSNGAGAAPSWKLASGGSPAGSSSWLQYNNSGAFGATSYLAYGGNGNNDFVISAPYSGATQGQVNIGLGITGFDGVTLGKFAGSASGTVIAANQASGFTGNFADFQLAGSSKFTIGFDGKITVVGIYSLPTTAGTAGSVLTSNGTGNQLYWSAASSGGGAGTVAVGTAARLAYYPGTGSSVKDATGFEYSTSGTTNTVRVYGGSAIGNTFFIINGIGTTQIRVGIGVTNPAYELEVKGNTAFGTTSDANQQFFISGNVASGSNFLEINRANTIRFYNSGNTFYSSLKGGANSANVNYTLPAADGSNLQVLYTNGSGGLGWTTVSASGGGIAITAGTGITFSTGVLITTSGTIRAKRPLVINFMSGFTPTASGADTNIIRIPDSPTDGTTALTYIPKEFHIRVETPSAGTSTIQLEKYTGTSAFSGTAVTVLSITGGAVYEVQSSVFANAGLALTSGDKLRLNFTALNATHANFSVTLELEEF